MQTDIVIQAEALDYLVNLSQLVHLRIFGTIMGQLYCYENVMSCVCVCAFWICNFHPSKIALQSDWEKVMCVEFNFFGELCIVIPYRKGTRPNHHTTTILIVRAKSYMVVAERMVWWLVITYSGGSGDAMHGIGCLYFFLTIHYVKWTE